MDHTKIVELHTTHRIEAEAIKTFLADNNITASIRDQFSEGIHAGIPTGLPDDVTLMVVGYELEKAKALVELFLKS